MAYYPIQVEKLLKRYEQIAQFAMKRSCARGFDEEELEILDEFLGHGREIRKERQRAAAGGEEPDFQPLIDAGAA